MTSFWYSLLALGFALGFVWVKDEVHFRRECNRLEREISEIRAIQAVIEEMQ